MSVLTYAVIADHKHAKKLGDEFLSKKYVWEDFAGLLCVPVVDALHSILSGTTPSPETSRPEEIIPLLYEEDPESGCWVYQVPDEWIKRISEIGDEEAPTLSKQLVKACWTISATTPEGCRNIEPYLIRLRDICKQALQKKSSLLLWHSL
ncbi:MAG TPA: hypothetical protein V6C81_14010 [Planktothrix sp.]|jgi:hypothetical protein